jgi:hypothetical protein
VSRRAPGPLARASAAKPASPKGGVLQRRCACGTHTLAGSECEACRGEGNRTPGAVPAIVHEVTGSPGQPLDDETRSSMEKRFGHALAGLRSLSRVPRTPQRDTRVNEPGDRYEQEADDVARRVMGRDESRGALTEPGRFDFSRVRVHTDPKARASAQAVGARAYTLGSHIVFNAGTYAPHEPAGEHLVAHELTHVEQQKDGDPAGGLVQRVGFFQAIARFFGGGTFSEEELQKYLKFLRENRTIENNNDSDNKAREVVRRWKAGDAAFHILEVNVRILLIQEMASGYLSGGDQQGILDLVDEAIPSERQTILAAMDSAMRSRFDDDARKRLEGITSQQDVDELSLGDAWSVAGVQRILHRQGDDATIRTIIDKGIVVTRFTTAYDKWEYDDKHVEEVELKGLYGNREGSELRIRASLDNQQAASTIFHEVGHYTSTVDAYLEQEIQARIAQEHFNIRHGLPTSEPGYRNADGTVNESEIRKSVTDSPHYNPTGRKRIGRRYEGEVPVSGWSIP